MPAAAATGLLGTRELIAALVAISPSITDIFLSLRRSGKIDMETVLNPPLADRPLLAPPAEAASRALPRHMGERLTHWPRN